MRKCAEEPYGSAAYATARTECTIALYEPLSQQDRLLALSRRGAAYMREGNIEGSLSDYTAALATATSASDRGPIHLQISQLKFMSGRTAEGDAKGELAVQENPRLAVLGLPNNRLAAMMFCVRSDTPRADKAQIEQCGRVLAAPGVSPDWRAKALLQRGDLYNAAGDLKRAEADYSAIVAEGPPKQKMLAYDQRAILRLNAGDKVGYEKDRAEAHALRVATARAQ